MVLIQSARSLKLPDDKGEGEGGKRRQFSHFFLAMEFLRWSETRIFRNWIYAINPTIPTPHIHTARSVSGPHHVNTLLAGASAWRVLYRLTLPPFLPFDLAVSH